MTVTSRIEGATQATVHVPLDTRAYDVRIGTGLIASAGAQILPFLRRPKVAVVTDENVASLHLDALRAGLGADGVEMTSLNLPAGESTKSWPHLSKPLSGFWTKKWSAAMLSLLSAAV